MGVISDKWKEMRQQVIDTFDMHHKEDERLLYLLPLDDTCNSLSIEGYNVDRTLVTKIIYEHGDIAEYDEKTVMVVKGYYQAFRKVMNSIFRIQEEHLNPAQSIESEFMDWYIEMWRLFIDAGIIKLSDIMGYRNRPVYIKNSWHVPPASHKILDYMDEYFECLKYEPQPEVCAILGHFFFTWIHPFNDGNGRMARFIMNVLLRTGGYSWKVVPFSMRNEYLNALEKASVQGDITDFTKLIAES